MTLISNSRNFAFNQKLPMGAPRVLKNACVGNPAFRGEI
jgi:hypothetical protein